MVYKRIYVVPIMLSLSLIGGCGRSVTAHDLRTEYVNKQEHLSEVASDAYNDAKDKAGEASDKAKDLAGQAADKASDVAMDAKDLAEDAADKKASEARDAADSLTDAVKEGARKTADGAKNAANDQIEDTKKDSEHISTTLKDEWHSFLETLMAPTSSFTDDSTDTDYTEPSDPMDGGSSKKQDSDGVDALGAYGNAAPTSVVKPPLSSSDVGEYQGSTVVTVNGNNPYFTSEDMTYEPFELYSPLDGLGRCGTAYANICAEIMPTVQRGDIGMVKPSGWHQAKYDILKTSDNPAGYLDNRCHLIAYSLAGENANQKNLITGTRHFNTEEGMEGIELQVLSYLKRNKGHHVLYRVTPVFEGENLMAKGVLMEGRSVEDDAINYCVFVYNVQPGIEIDYRTGESRLAG